MSILIKNVLHAEQQTDIYIEKNLIKKISPNITNKADHIIDGTGKAAIPGFYNTHTHAAMTLTRGFSDDLVVQEWLEKKIWPFEAKLSAEDIYWGTKLACLEMIKTGTLFFSDMYWFFNTTAQAVDEMGLRAAISGVLLDLFDEAKMKEQIKQNEQFYSQMEKFSDRLQYVVGPHSIYTVSEKSLKWAKDFAKETGCKLHIHLSETEKEVKDCLEKHGKRPVEYLEEIGFLGPNVILAHALWLDKNEIDIIQSNQVNIAHLPISNMKLSSGVLQYNLLKKSNITLTLGTDGCASNNNLDMIEEMKVASILAKLTTGDPTIFPAEEVFEMATKNGAELFGINSGIIKEGKVADLILINLDHHSMVPLHNLISNLVYSANGNIVDTTICDGKILMKNGIVEDEDLIKSEVRRLLKNIN